MLAYLKLKRPDRNKLTKIIGWALIIEGVIFLGYVNLYKGEIFDIRWFVCVIIGTCLVVG